MSWVLTIAGFAAHASRLACSVAAAVVNCEFSAEFCAWAAGTASAGLKPRLPFVPEVLTLKNADDWVWT